MTAYEEHRQLLAESVEKLFRDLMEDGLDPAAREALAAGQVPAALWRAVQEQGIAGVLVPEQAGGFGGGWLDACVVLGHLGFHALPLPLAETLLAQRLLADAGIAVPAAPIAIAIADAAQLHRGADGGWRLSGSAAAVPWGNAAPFILVACTETQQVALVAADAVTIGARGHSIAGEPRADLAFAAAPVLATGACARPVFALCALLRVAQIGGALDAALRRSVFYANERVQFGKPIGKFQAIQHALALLADEAAAVNCAALAACRAADHGDAGFEIAAAKLRANRAVGVATSIAHQVHGAIGFTREHPLHRLTQRLWSWRSEFGNDRHWAEYLGARVARLGADGLWADLTGRSDRCA